MAGEWSEWQDLNLRPPRPERGALPGCATLRPSREPSYSRDPPGPQAAADACSGGPLRLGGEAYIGAELLDQHMVQRGIGAWPSGKATGFGPVIPGSNPGAPATGNVVRPGDMGSRGVPVRLVPFRLILRRRVARRERLVGRFIDLVPLLRRVAHRIRARRPDRRGDAALLARPSRPRERALQRGSRSLKTGRAAGSFAFRYGLGHLRGKPRARSAGLVSPDRMGRYRVTALPAMRPMTRKTRKITRKMPKSTFAMVAAPAARPVKPKAAAISATIRKIKAHLSMLHPLAEFSALQTGNPGRRFPSSRRAR